MLERLVDRAQRRNDRILRELGEEFRHARLRLGLSQQQVADAARIDRSELSRIERARLPYLTFRVGCRIGAVLGIDVSVRAFPGGQPIRDAGQATRLKKLIEAIGPPLVYETEAVLQTAAGTLEQRSWDLVLRDQANRRAIEFEARLYDVQAQLRRLKLKWRDDRVESLLIVVADTAHNRRVLSEYGDTLLADFPRLRTHTVLDLLRAGQHPPTGLILLDAPLARAPRDVGGAHDPGPDDRPAT